MAKARTKKSSAVNLPKGQSYSNYFVNQLADLLDPPELKLPSPKDAMPTPPDIVDWAHHNFIDPTTARLVTLVDFQQRMLRKIFEMIFRNQISTVVYSTIKKSGKCAAATDKIELASGDVVEFGSLIGKQFKLRSVGFDMRIVTVSAKADDNGQQPCIQIATELGYVYKRTFEHPFLVEGQGWTTAQDIRIGDYLLAYDGKSFVKDAVVSVLVLEPLSTVAIETENHVYLSTCIEHNTTSAGIAGAYWAQHIETPNEVISVANDAEQAQGRIYAAMVPTMKRLLWEVPDSKPEMKSTTGSKIRAISTNYAGEAGGNYGLTLWSELWAYSCLSADTEIYTAQGWKSLQDLTLKDEFATINDAGELEYQKASKIGVYYHKGTMWHLDHRRADLLVTPNHRVVGRFWNGGRSKQEARTQHHSIIQADKVTRYSEGDVITQSDWKGKEKKTFTLPAVIVGSVTYPAKTLPMDPWLTLVGQFLADGSVGYYTHKKTSYPVCVHISKRSDNQLEHNSTEFRCMADRSLKKLGIDYRVLDNSIKIYDRQVASYLSGLGKAVTKYVPSEYKKLSARQLKLLLTGYLMGDGENIGRDGWRASTVSKALYDDLFEIGIKTGYTVRGFDATSFNTIGNAVYRLSLTTTQPVWQKAQWKRVQYDGLVYCPTVPNGTIYVRRNGKSCWTGNSEARQRLWEEMTPVPTRKYSVRWVETYAGFLGESTILWNLYCQAFRDGDENKPLGERVPGLEDLPCYYIPNSQTFVYWDHEPRMPWQTPEYYTQQQVALRPKAFQRLHQNRWVASEDVFIEPRQWDELDRCEALKEDGDNRAIVLAADGSIHNDLTTLEAVHFDIERQGPDALRTWMWRPIKGEGDSKPTVDLVETLGAKIDELLGGENVTVLAVVYDPYQLHAVMTELKKKYDRLGTKNLFVEFPQTNARVAADQSLYTSIISRKLRHNGDLILREHILNAVVDETTRGFRLDKEKTSNKIDAAVALSMASYTASQRQKPKKRFISA